MSPFESVAIGNTGVKVTRLGLGGAAVSGMVLADGLYRGSGYEESLRIIRRSYEIGIRHFDTAPLYGCGRSENRYGQVLSALPRDSFSLATKVSRRLVPGEPGAVKAPDEDGIPNYTYEFDFTAKGIRRTLESSLERLKLDHVDILYLHDSDFDGEHTVDQFAEGLEALVEMRAAGTVKAIGMGMNQWEVTARMVERFDLDIILLAGRYTLLEQSALPEFMPLCLERSVRLSIGGPYNSGILASNLDRVVSFDYAAASPEIVGKAKRIKAICDRHQVGLKAAALQFVAAHPAVATIIPGSASVSEVEENARMLQEEIPAALWDELKTEKLLPQRAPTPA
jgi:D-threo-aldose 1-dehydrogenase